MFSIRFPILAVLAASLRAAAAEPDYNRDVRPILSENCFLCHGQDPKHRGADLRLDVRENATAQREGGAAIVPGKPEESAIIKRMVSTDPDLLMPPPDAHMKALDPAQVRVIADWIKAGATYDPHWAFVAPVKKSLPTADLNPVDAFVRMRLKQEGLKPNPAADDETQLRRLYLDLTGLPPGIQEIESYLADESPDRWQRRIDRLMDSPHFAERMAMPWLDAARYADTHGFSIDDHRDMWAWRDWVIHAFQTNQPYDQFVIEQLAGDLIPNATPDQIAATGFLRNSMNTHEGGTIAEEYRVAYTVDKVDAVSTAMLGLTMKCAQCHDHKYDPISQREYFSMYAFFNSSSEPGKGATNANTKPVMEYRSPLGDGGMAGLKARLAELHYLRAHPSAQLVAARESWEGQVDASKPPFSIPREKRILEDWKQINKAYIESKSSLSDLMAITLKTIDVEIGVIQKDIKRGKTTVMVMDYKPDLRKTYILDRGAYDQPLKDEEIFAGTPSVLPPLNGDDNPTRLDFANWVVAKQNPLTARVVVNRLWQMLFGIGLVETVGDFGNQGSWPSHPELLDWLAVELMEKQWNQRHILKLILHCETYRQSAAATAESLEKDPRATLLSRSPRTRLAAEIIRDQALAVSGLLNPTVGGPGVHPPQPDLWSEISHFGYQNPFTAQIFLPGRGESIRRRSIYTFWKRTSPPPNIALFDAPTRETCTVLRGNTNTPLQALVVMNDPQYVEAAIAFGRHMIKKGGDTDSSRLSFGFRTATGRLPDERESKLLASAYQHHFKTFSKDPDAAQKFVGSREADVAAYAMVANTLLNLDELISRP